MRWVGRAGRARASRKRVRPSAATASPRGDRAHAFLAGSQESAGARLALGCLSSPLRLPFSHLRFSRSARSPPAPALISRSSSTSPRKGRVKSRCRKASPSLRRDDSREATRCCAARRTRHTRRGPGRSSTGCCTQLSAVPRSFCRRCESIDFLLQTHTLLEF